MLSLFQCAATTWILISPSTPSGKVPQVARPLATGPNKRWFIGD